VPRARVNGVSLYYEEAGRGRALVLSHGFSATARMWEGQVAAFRDRYRIITYDTRGQGRSEVPADPAAYSQPIMVEDLRQLIAHLGLDRPVVCGLSMGGNVVLNLALADPEGMAGAVVCGTGAGSEDPEAWALTIQGWIELLEGPGIEAFAEMYLADPILADYADRSPAAREFLWRAITSNTARGLALGLRGVVGKRPTIYSLRERLVRLALPATIIVGDRDHWCTKVSTFLAATIPGAELVGIADSGHMSNLEQPEQFNRALSRFLERVWSTAT
jgi:pimeloyl-ACP methyl ester carboxylesterase